MNNSRYLRWQPLALAAGIVLLRLPSLSEPQWASDDGFFTAVAAISSRGVPLYAGVYDNSPPVIYWLHRLLIGLGSLHDHLLVQLVATAAVVASALLTYAVVKRVAPVSTALLAGSLAGFALSIPTLDGDLLGVELVALPIFLAALLLAFGTRSVGLLAAGALLGLALATRPSYAVDSLALAVPLLSGTDRSRRITLVAAGVLVTFAAVAVALAAEGSLNAYLAVVLPSDRSYLVWANGGTLLPLYTRLAVLAIAGLIVLARCRTTAARLATVWLFASVAGSSLTPRELSHYAQEAIPALAFATALVTTRFGRRAVAYPVAAVALVLAAEMVLFLPGAQTAIENGNRPGPLVHYFAYTDLPAYYANWLDYADGARSRDQYIAWFPGEATTDVAEAVRLRALAGPGPMRIVVLGDRPWLFVHSGALPDSRFIATNSSFWRVAGSAAQVADRLRQGCPDVVVYQSGPGDWAGDLEAGGYRLLDGMPWPTYLRGKAAGSCP
jgi:hypothetical protein